LSGLCPNQQRQAKREVNQWLAGPTRSRANKGRKAVAFIERALAITEPWQGQVAMLLRRDFDSAPGRVHLFRDHPAFAATIVLLGRITWFEPRVASPAENHAWFLWDWQHRGTPTTIYATLARHRGYPRHEGITNSRFSDHTDQPPAPTRPEMSP
jgi:hypothetical protein